MKTKTIRKAAFYVTVLTFFATSLVLNTTGSLSFSVAGAVPTTTGGPGDTTLPPEGWVTNKKMASVRKKTGTEERRVWIPGLPPGIGYWQISTVDVYETVDCCVTATDSDACNSGAQSPKC